MSQQEKSVDDEICKELESGITRLQTDPVVSEDRESNDGNTALHLLFMDPPHAHDPSSSLFGQLSWSEAVENGCKELLRKGVDVNLQNKDGNTALHLLFMYPFMGQRSWSESVENIFEELVENGVGVNLQNKDGNTALHSLFMCSTYYTPGPVIGRSSLSKIVEHMCKKLLRNGVDVNLQNENGNTALHLLFIYPFMGQRSWSESVEHIFEELVENGVGVNLQNKIAQRVNLVSTA